MCVLLVLYAVTSVSCLLRVLVGVGGLQVWLDDAQAGRDLQLGDVFESYGRLLLGDGPSHGLRTGYAAYAAMFRYRPPVQTSLLSWRCDPSPGDQGEITVRGYYARLGHGYASCPEIYTRAPGGWLAGYCVVDPLIFQSERIN